MPNRILKESICTSEDIDKLSPFEETMFYRLIVNCDDFGRMDARAKILKSKLFPLRDVRASQIEDALMALSSAELVDLYEVDGKPFLQMKTWAKHQQVRAKKSKYPAPDSMGEHGDNICKQMIADDSKCPRNPIQSNPNPIQSESYSTGAPAREAAETEGNEFGKAIGFYMDKIQTPPPQMVIAQMQHFVDVLGAEVAIHAMEIALSEKKTGWSYISGILRRYESERLTTLQAVEEAEKAFTGKKARRGARDISDAGRYACGEEETL